MEGRPQLIPSAPIVGGAAEIKYSDIARPLLMRRVDVRGQSWILGHRFPPWDKKVKTVATNDTECELEQYRYLSTVRVIKDGDNSADIAICSQRLPKP